MAKKPFASWTETRKEKHIAYDQKNYSVIGCKLPRAQADAFRQHCASQGRSVSAVLAEYVRAQLANSGPVQED